MATLSSIAHRLSPVSLPEMKFSLLNFHERLRLRQSSENLAIFPLFSETSLAKHSRRIGISVLFIPTWTMAEQRAKDSPPERFKSIRFSAFESRISARSRASGAQVFALNSRAFGTSHLRCLRRSRCCFLSFSIYHSPSLGFKS